jgi:hypothetical protein
MAIVFPDMTVARVLEINPMAAQVLFRHGVRSFFAPGIANETLENLSQKNHFNLSVLIRDLNEIIQVGTDFLRQM